MNTLEAPGEIRIELYRDVHTLSLLSLAPFCQLN